MSEHPKDANDTAAAAIAEGRDPREALRERIANRKRAKAAGVARGEMMPDAAPTPVLVCMSDVKAERVRWLWPSRIALGKLALVCGDPGEGKSHLTLDWAARVSTGTGWPDAPELRTTPGGVVLLSAEDDPADTIRPRLDAACADARRITLLAAMQDSDYKGNPTRRAFNLAQDLEALETAITSVEDCRLVIVDPISAYLGKTDTHKNAEIRAVLAPLGELAARRGVAVVAVTHLRKGEGVAIYRAMGSLAFVAAARAVFAVARDPKDETGKRRLFVPVKCNLSADRAGFAYQLVADDGETAHVVWERDPITVDVDDLLAGASKRRGPAPEGRDSAAEWLREELANGARPSQELFDAGKKEGHSKRTLWRAKAALHIRARKARFDGQWTWELPEAEVCHEVCQPAPDTGTHGNPGTLGTLGENPNEYPMSINKSSARETKSAKLFETGGHDA